MNASTQATGTREELSFTARTVQFINAHHALCVFLYLAVIELIAFGPIVAKVGFYLDDWNMIAFLHFAPQPLLHKIWTYMLKDPKVIIRPIEAIHFGLLHTIFGAKPLYWHLVNGFLEVCSAWLVYLCVNKLTLNRVLSLICAAVFLLYPNHDSTHYWVLASSATLSMATYLASLWFNMRAAESGRIEFEVAAVTCFAVSIFSYECFLPLLIFNAACAYWMSGSKSGSKSASTPSTPMSGSFSGSFSGSIPASIPASMFGKPATDYARLISLFRSMLPMGAVVAAYAIWSRVIAPHIATAWVHHVTFSPAVFANTVARGLAVTASTELPEFCNKLMIMNATYKGTEALIAGLTITCLTTLLCLTLSNKPLSPRSAGKLISLGLAIIVVSFLIFGLNAEYEPTLYTFVNRINYGGALGAALAIGTILYFAAASLKQVRSARVAATVGTTALLMFLTFSNWALAKPWIISWTMQRHVASMIKSNKAAVLGADTVMLADCPRFVRWSPVFDGVWDFRSMARVMTNNNKLEANVISERLEVTPNGVMDRSHDFICGDYKFKNMLVIDAPHCQLLPVNSAADFIRVVRTNGMGFDLDRELPARWERQLLAATNRPL